MPKKNERSFFAIYGVPDSKVFPESCIERFKSLERKRVFRDIRYIGKSGVISIGKQQKAYSKFKKVFNEDFHLWKGLSHMANMNNAHVNSVEGFVIRAEIFDEDLFEGGIRNSFDSVRKQYKVECSWYDFEDAFTKPQNGKVKS